MSLPSPSCPLLPTSIAQLLPLGVVPLTLFRPFDHVTGYVREVFSRRVSGDHFPVCPGGRGRDGNMTRHLPIPVKPGKSQ